MDDAFDQMSSEKFLIPLHRKRYRESKAAAKRKRALARFLRDESIPWRHRYREYIKSDRWQGLRRQMIRERGAICERCGRPDPKVNLHHLTYVRLGSELPEDMKLLCFPCHKLMHPGWD